MEIIKTIIEGKGVDQVDQRREQERGREGTENEK